MGIQRSTDWLDILERVLDRGVVIEAWAGVSIGGIHLLDVDARILVASFATYTNLAGTVATATSVVSGTPAPQSCSTDDLHALDGERPRASSEIAPRRRTPRLRRRRAAAPRLWACAQGCTFQGPARWRQPALPCPYDKGRRCTLTAA